MPVKVDLGGNEKEFIYPTTEWKELELNLDNARDFELDDDGFYFDVKWN